jgi:hypothetical protein
VRGAVSSVRGAVCERSSASEGSSQQCKRSSE